MNHFVLALRFPVDQTIELLEVLGLPHYLGALDVRQGSYLATDRAQVEVQVLHEVCEARLAIGHNEFIHSFNLHFVWVYRLNDLAGGLWLRLPLSSLLQQR